MEIYDGLQKIEMHLIKHDSLILKFSVFPALIRETHTSVSTKAPH